MIGVSHATRLAEAIQKTGAPTILAAKQGWRVSAAAVESLLGLANKRMDEADGRSKEDVLIDQLFDNSSHMARSEECILLLHWKDASIPHVW
jgi:hypothetical protein